MYYRGLAKRVGNAVRLAEIVQVLVRHGFSDIVGRLGLTEGLPAKALRALNLVEQADAHPNTMGKRFRAVLTELGPTAVKFGQVLSTRPDLVGAGLADELGYLQDRVEAVPFEQITPVLTAELGGALEDHFAEFDSRPIAAASLSQVYRAKLLDGTPVVVKVQRPGIRAVINSDLSLMETIAEWVHDNVSDFAWMDPVGTVREFARSLRRELDFTTEASMIERFRVNHAEIDEVFIPSIYPEVSTEFVLTMDFVDGVRIDDLDAFEARNCDPERVALTTLDILCKQIFEFNLFHADPHPGNIKLMRDDTIAFIDYGMVGHLERSDVESMAELLSAFISQNTERAVRALMAFTPDEDIEPPDSFISDIGDFVAFEAPLLVQGGEFAEAVNFVTETLRQNELQIRPRFSLLLKALATVEVTAHRIDPDLELIPVLQPYIEQVVLDRLAPPGMLEGAQYDLPALARMVREAPGDAFGLLRKLRRGRFRVTVTAEGLLHLSNALDRASNRVAFATIMGGLIIGSSILMSAELAPRGIGLVGFSIAGVLGLGLAVSILRSRNY